MNILQEALAALKLIEEGRSALDAIASAISDGREALGAGDMSKLDTMLEHEKEETKAAYDSLSEAINQASD